MKISVIGGGSYAWTKNLASDFLVDGFFDGAEICLMDVNTEALDQVYQLCQNLNALADIHINFTRTTDLTEAVRDAAYVIPAVAIGGMDADIQDHQIGRGYGVWNIKGHDIGPAGFSRLLRHLPFIVTLGRIMEKHAPDAMMFNVTNPLVPLTRSVNRYTRIRSVGFCHGVVNHLKILFPLLGAERMEEVDFVTAGVDHCSWLLSLKVNGQDGFEIMREKGLIEAAYRREHIAEMDDPYAGREAERLRFVIWDKLGYFPAISDDHICEFFPQFLKSPEVRQHWSMHYDRLIERPKTMTRARETVLQLLAGKDPLHLEPSGEIIARAIAALHGRHDFIDVLNAPNVGQIPNLPAEAIVETKCRINGNGIQPVTVGPLPELLESIVRPVSLRHTLYMEAAYEWNREKAAAALSTDPLVNDFINSKDMVDDYFAVNQQILESLGMPVKSWQ